MFLFVKERNDRLLKGVEYKSSKFSSSLFLHNQGLFMYIFFAKLSLGMEKRTGPEQYENDGCILQLSEKKESIY